MASSTTYSHLQKLYLMFTVLCQHTMAKSEVLLVVFKALKIKFEKLHNNVSSYKQHPANSESETLLLTIFL